MATLNLLYQTQYAINDSIRIIIPTVGEIIDNEDEYYSLVSALTAMPIDYMVPLDDAGIDFTKLNDYELFLILFNGLKAQDTKLIFGDLNLANFVIKTSPQNGKPILYDGVNDITIDRAIHGQIAAVLRKIHHLEKNRRKPANQEAKEYMIERARMKMKRNRKHESQLEQLIVAMVNAQEYKYDYEGTRELSIYKFNESVRQVIKRVDYNNRMYGVYAGTINPKNMSQDDLNWLVHK